MSKKHFKALAEAISTIKDDAERFRTAHLVASVCCQFNVNFNRSTFFDACNVDPYGE